jgi:hypothetical protein
LKENLLTFNFGKNTLELEDDFLIRIRHFLSSEIRYPVLRVFLSPVLVFNGYTKIPSSFIDFGDGVDVSESFFVQIEVETVKERLSNCFLNVDAVMKNNKYNGSKHSESGTNRNDEMIDGKIFIENQREESVEANQDVFSIGDDDDNAILKDEENLKNDDKMKIDHLIELVELNKLNPEVADLQKAIDNPKEVQINEDSCEENKVTENESPEEDDDEEYFKSLERNA